MLPNVPACFYSDEEVELCMKQTGKNKKEIKNWEKCLRFRMSHRSHEEIEKYLKASPESLEGKVMILSSNHHTCIENHFSIESEFKNSHMTRVT